MAAPGLTSLWVPLTGGMGVGGPPLADVVDARSRVGAAIARRAGVSRTFLYDNPDARTTVAAAINPAAGRQRQQPARRPGDASANPPPDNRTVTNDSPGLAPRGGARVWPGPVTAVAPADDGVIVGDADEGFETWSAP